MACDQSIYIATTSFPTRCVLASLYNHSAVNFLKGSFLLLLFALASCSPRYGLAERGSHVATAHVDKTTSATRDTVLVREKVRFVKINDTVYRDSFISMVKVSSKIDTLIQIDSVLISDTIRVITFRDPRNFFQKTADRMGNVFTLLAVIVLIVQLLKLKKHD